MKRILLVALAVTVALVVCAQSDEGEKPAPEAVKEAKTEVVKEEVKEPAKVDFEKPVVTLFAKRCAGCHGAEGGSAGLALVEKPVLSGALVVASSQMTDMHIVKPGHPAKSYLMLKVKGAEGIKGKRMPPSGDALTADEIAALEAWIAAMGTPKEKAQEAAAEMKVKKEAVEEKGEKAAEEMKAKEEAVKEKAEKAAEDVKVEKEAAEQKAEKAEEEMKAGEKVEEDAETPAEPEEEKTEEE